MPRSALQQPGVGGEKTGRGTGSKKRGQVYEVMGWVTSSLRHNRSTEEQAAAKSDRVDVLMYLSGEEEKEGLRVALSS